MNIYILLLAGGSGKRIWPYTDDKKGKQFIPLFEYENQTNISPIQRIYLQLKKEFTTEEIIVATSETQKELVKKQLGEDTITVIEPAKKDTFAAITFSTLYIQDVLKANKEDIVVVLPTDSIVESSYAKKIRQMALAIKNKNIDLALMAIAPNAASTKFGYIVGSKEKDGYIEVQNFIEKPPLNKAKELIEKGAFINGGVFAFKIEYLLEFAKANFAIESYKQMQANYNSLIKTSFDYAVVQKAKKVGAIIYDGKWQDIGTWDSLIDLINQDKESLQIKYESNNTTILNELNVPIVTVGTDNIIVVATENGILIVDSASSDKVKEAVELLK